MEKTAKTFMPRQDVVGIMWHNKSRPYKRAIDIAIFALCAFAHTSIEEHEQAIEYLVKVKINLLLDIIAGGGFIIKPGKGKNRTNCNYCDYSLICGDEKTGEQMERKKGGPENTALNIWSELKKYA